MIKKIFYILSFLTLSLSILKAQEDARLLNDGKGSTSYWLNSVPFYELPPLQIGDYYSHQLEIKIPKDTLSSLGDKVLKFRIEDIRIINVNNIPEGLSYSQRIVNNSNEKYIRLYFELYGRPSNNNLTSITVKLSTKLSVNKGKSVVRTSEIGNIVFKKGNNSNRMETYRGDIGLKALRYYPDPIENKTEVSFWSSKLQLVEFEVRDAIGNLKYRKQFTAKAGSNTISFSQDELPNGLYLYSIRTDDQLLAKRLIIN